MTSIFRLLEVLLSYEVSVNFHVITQQHNMTLVVRLLYYYFIFCMGCNAVYSS